MLPQRALAYRPLRSPHLRSHRVTFGRGPLPPTPTALPSDGSSLQSQGTGDGRGGARVVPAPDVAGLPKSCCALQLSQRLVQKAPYVGSNI
ncbi:hypothetical protein R6Z07F_012762 [Ovis aries]